MPDHDTMNVTSFEVVPARGSSKGAVAVMSGPPHPRAMALNFDEKALGSFAVVMLRAMNTLDHDQLVAGLRAFLAEVGAAGAPAGAQPPIEGTDLSWLFQLAGALQRDGRLSGLSDPVIGSLVAASLTEAVLTVIADQELGKRTLDGSLFSGRMNLLGLAQQAPWTVQLDGDRSLDVDPDRGQVSVFTSSTTGSNKAFEVAPAVAYRLGIILQVAAYVAASGGQPAASEAATPESPVESPAPATTPAAMPLDDGGARTRG